MHPRFTPKTLSFLRSLKRNNRREWFMPRKEEYEADVRAPMVAVVETLAKDFRKFAPELEASPKTSIFRVYRDTRFSEDKTPYKTHIAAAFTKYGSEKTCGYYVGISPDEIEVGGGVYMTSPENLRAIRSYLADHYEEFLKITAAKEVRRLFGELQGESLTRIPKGFPVSIS